MHLDFMWIHLINLYSSQIIRNYPIVQERASEDKMDNTGTLRGNNTSIEFELVTQMLSYNSSLSPNPQKTSVVELKIPLMEMKGRRVI